MPSRNDQVILGYKFLRKHALDGTTFTTRDILNATGWSKASLDTYRSKHWGDLVESTGKPNQRIYKVKKEFIRVSEDEFVSNAAQKRLITHRYRRAKHELVLQFEFLLPLSKEEQLKRALDELFYENTLRSRIDEIGITHLQTIIPTGEDENKRDYIKRVLKIVSGYFGGYSISHVQGRFRAADLATLPKAAATMAGGGRYLIDETTALVRFIAPCNTTNNDFGDDFASIVDALVEKEFVESLELKKEILLIRCVFFFFFVETVIRTVKGEDEIWLLETGTRRRLYKWMKQ